ncbi:T7SS effector LXG polymorphic toxin [Clostridium neuense]|uniref:T7SS effector LXG polymorphic toxin n=1 Tax=Clostridium neuense TaxID=1728934 RepID=A0ABW8TAA0_9CLOT
MGLIYSSSDSENLISGLRANIGSAKAALEDLVSASKRLTSSIGAGKALDGSAFNAGKDLFSALIIPTIHRASSVFDDTKKHLSQYESANEEVSGEGVLDEDKLNAKKVSTEEIKAATDSTASTLRAMASTAEAASLFSVASSLNESAQSLENYSESLQQDLDKIEDKLRKLYKFNSAVNGLFNDDLNNFKLVVQSVMVLNDTVVDSKTGSYSLPDGIDESWFTSIKINANNYIEGGKTAYDVAVGSKITSALVAGIDKLIGLDIEAVVGKGKKVSPNKISANLKKLGYNHAYRRGFLRNIPKDVRDLEVDIPEILNLGKGTGILTVGLTGASVIGDIKNNKTIAQKAEASGIDISMTGASYLLGGVAVGVIGTFALPEEAIVGLSIGAAAGIGTLANWATEKIKKAIHLW